MRRGIPHRPPPRALSLWLGLLALATPACSDDPTPKREAAEEEVPASARGSEAQAPAEAKPLPPTPPMPARQQGERNLLLITLDTTRADFLGAYGHPERVSPHLDALSARSLLFERAYATSPRTGPSHASILTARHPSEHGVVFNGLDIEGAIDGDTPTLAQHLRARELATAGVVSSGALDGRYGFDRGFAHFEVVLDHDLEPEVGGGSRRVVAAAQRWLKAHQRERFFLWVHFYEAHLPFHSEPSVYAALGMKPPPTVTTIQRQRSSKPQPVDEARQAYRAEVFELDGHVGALLGHLDALGLRDETVVAVVADHGEYLSEHGQWGHQQLYDEMLHVPMFVAAPDFASGQRRAAPVSIIDLAPTLLELLKVEALPGASGVSQVQAGSDDAQRALFAEWRDENPFLGRRKARAGDFLLSVQRGPHKLIRDVLQPTSSMLFDLGADPDEAKNLIDTQPAQAEALGALLDAHVEAMPARAQLPGEAKVDDQTVEMLRSLGYVE